MALPEVRTMATELIGQNLVLRQCHPVDLPAIPRDPEGAFFDPQVGLVLEPRYFAILLGAVAIGDCAIYNPTPTEVEFGIRIAANHRSKGYGAEAAKILSDYCLSVLGFSRVHLKVLPFNERAIKSYEKAGFTRCGKIVVDAVEFVKMGRIRA